MEQWEEKARRLFPDLRCLQEGQTCNVWHVCGEFFHRCRQAHGTNDVEELCKIYEYMAWCFWTGDIDVFNAAALGFYEQLVMYPVTLEAVPYWLDQPIFRTMCQIFIGRLKSVELRALWDRYYTVKKVPVPPIPDWLMELMYPPKRQSKQG